MTTSTHFFKNIEVILTRIYNIVDILVGFGCLKEFTVTHSYRKTV